MYMNNENKDKINRQFIDVRLYEQRVTIRS